jgi:hypothetical protein
MEWPMKKRLVQAVAISAIASVAGVGVALWQKPDQMVGIVIGAAVVGFVLGLLFEFHLG